ncbi:MAG: ribonuclease E/G [Alphaproteobacteria bacterium]
MLIDAAHPEETRVVVMDGLRVDDFDFETLNKRQLRGNIYLAKVTRVEPSLQAAFVDYGGNRHGFLAFGEIHPDYYQIPVADREKLKAEVEALGARGGRRNEPAETEADGETEAGGEASAEGQHDHDDDDEDRAEEERRRMLSRRYKIQEVIKRRQIMLVQVVKEERGNKGAALTTYLSLAGRYCVLMPNTGRGGGISRKITSGPDRKRLKKVAAELDVPQGMGLIIRTAGAKRTKTEIKRDYEYLLRAWENIRDLTLRSIAPALIYEESSLVKRAIRDLYDKDVGEIYVEGDGAYREAKDFVRMLMPSHAKRVHHYREPTPIFAKHGTERQLESIYSPIVNLKSGGYIVINQTEALVAIDVNSGRATRERGIEQTAFKTNCEAAEEAARQMRLRDLAGLIVIDFIDMEEAKNDRAVEKKVKDALRFDRARIQVGKISSFGLMELSRQRRRTGVLEGSSHICATCQGSGRVRSVESSALRLLRALDEEAIKGGETVEARAPTEVALYLLNEKREAIAHIEESRRVRIRVTASPGLSPPDFELQSHGERPPEVEAELAREAERRAAADAAREAAEAAQDSDVEDDEELETIDADGAESETGDRAVAAEAAGEPSPRATADSEGAPREDGQRRKRRRGRRGGRRRNGEEQSGVAPEGNGELLADDASDHESDGEGPAETVMAPAQVAEGEEGERPNPSADGVRTGRRRRRRRGRGGRGAAGEERTPQLGETSEAGGENGGYDDEDAPEPAEPVIAALVSFDPEPPAPAEAEAPEKVEAFAPVEAAPAAAAEIVAPAPAAAVDYAPDEERRAKFFARLHRWGKKEAG